MARHHPGRASAPSMMRMLVSAFVMLALIIGPVRPVATAAAAQPIDTVICHAPTPDAVDAGQLPAKVPEHGHDCQLCPACQLAGQPGIVPAETAFVPAPTTEPIPGPALRPFATGPPRRVRAATPPTGPPGLFV